MYICKYCKKEFISGPKLGGHIVQCKLNPKYNELRAKKLISAANNFEKTKNIVEIPCKKCGVLFTQIIYGKQRIKKCCSTSCAKSRTHSLEVRAKIMRSVYKHYGSKINYTTQECINKISNTKKCEWCGDILNPRNSKFCSLKCFFEYRHDYTKNIVLSDNIESLTVKNPSPVVKKVLIEKYGNKCMKCGWAERNQWTQNIPIEIEHKDGNSDNWKLENLELLCPNCHALTRTYKGANLGNGRYYRKQRYKEGKSY